MPIVHIDIIKRPVAAKRRMVYAVTEAIATALDVSPDSVCVVVNEMKDDQYAVAGVLWGDKAKAKKKIKKPTQSSRKRT
ncbi:MAG: tautomerase family protein [Bdellovibrionales bacterium]|jgi:4-oxalocrotonate tautomerase